MCCLKNEQETYEYLNRKLPGVGDIVTLPDGMKGEVSGVNVLRQLVKVLVDVNDEKEMRECPVEELKFKPKHKKEKAKRRKKTETAPGSRLLRKRQNSRNKIDLECILKKVSAG